METEKNILDNIELRSENVQDILTKPPHWIIQWGNTLIFIIFLIMLLMSYVIKYPEFIPAPIIVTTQSLPEKLEARINSKIDKILVKNNQQVKKDDILLVLQSTADYEDVIKLKRIIESTPHSQIIKFPLLETSNYKLGEIQEDYNNFVKVLQEEKMFINLKPYTPENIATIQNISETENRITILKHQLKLETEKLELSKKNYSRQKSLYEQGVISRMELENERIRYLQAEQDIKNISVTISQLQESIVILNKTKNNTNISMEKDKNTLYYQTILLFEQLRKSVKQWEQNYLIISSTEGKVSFQQIYGENQFVKVGDVMISVFPKDNTLLIGRMLVPSINSGKINIGEKVLIKLDNYRYQEYGIVEGKVKTISLTPDTNGNYFVDVYLPHGLKTSYNKKIPFDKELKGNAEIVTEDLRLIERFFFQLRKLIGYQN